MKICSIEGCGKRARGRGWCWNHYALWRKYGNPLEKHNRWDGHVPVFRPCTFPGCIRPYHSNGFCTTHLQRVIRRGDASIVLPPRRKYQFNERLLDTWTRESAYVLGWALTDGNVADTQSRNLSFHLKDMEAIEILKGLFQHPKPIILQKGYPFLALHSVHLVNRLKELGVTPAKRLTAALPKVPENVLSHFIRGVIDGDGTIQLRGDYLRVIVNGASHVFMSGLRDILPFRGSFFATGVKTRKHVLWRLVYSGIEAKKLCAWLYQDSEGLRLSRKYEHYLAAL